MKSEFLEEDEDWVWKNAIRKDEKVICPIDSSLRLSDRVVNLRFITRRVMPRQLQILSPHGCGMKRASEVVLTPLMRPLSCEILHRNLPA